MTMPRNQPRLARFALSVVTYDNMSFMGQSCTNITLAVAGYGNTRACAHIPGSTAGFNKIADDVVPRIHANQGFVARIASQLGAKVRERTQ